MKHIGMQIVVMDAGFVYVGECILNDGFLLISGAKNIRQWGTTKGLGELRNGPTRDTVLDDAGEVTAPIGRVVHFIECAKGWKK